MEGLSDSMLLVSIQWIKISMDWLYIFERDIFGDLVQSEVMKKGSLKPTKRTFVA